MCLMLLRGVGSWVPSGTSRQGQQLLWYLVAAQAPWAAPELSQTPPRCFPPARAVPQGRERLLVAALGLSFWGVRVACLSLSPAECWPRAAWAVPCQTGPQGAQ